MKGDRGEKSPGSTERCIVEKAEMGKKGKMGPGMEKGIEKCTDRGECKCLRKTNKNKKRKKSSR